jgi:hypothetical protein
MPDNPVEMKAIIVIKRIVAFLLLSVFLSFNVLASEKIYVFFPSNINSQSMQDKMTDIIKGVNITVFGKYNEFISRINSEPPDAVITKTMLVKEQLGNYEIQLNGERKGKTVESYVILSTGEQFSVGSVNSETVIGVLDIMGRTGMSTFSKLFFPIQPKLKRVSKLEDLLSLLSFDMIAGIMVEDIFTEYFKATSQMQFNITPLKNANTGIVAFAVKKGGNAEKNCHLSEEQRKKNMRSVFN